MRKSTKRGHKRRYVKRKPEKASAVRRVLKALLAKRQLTAFVKASK